MEKVYIYSVGIYWLPVSYMAILDAGQKWELYKMKMLVLSSLNSLIEEKNYTPKEF